MICVEFPQLVAIAEKWAGLAFPVFGILNHSL